MTTYMPSYSYCAMHCMKMICFFILNKIVLLSTSSHSNEKVPCALPLPSQYLVSCKGWVPVSEGEEYNEGDDTTQGNE